MKKILALLLCVSMLFSSAVLAADVKQAHAAGLANFTKVNEYPAGKFTDVATSSWYYESVKTAFELGLVKGSSDTAFNPTGNMTVAEAIALASRIHSIYGSGKAEFVQGTPWYEVYVTYAANNQLIAGVQEDGTVKIGSRNSDLSAPITRAQFAVIFCRTMPSEEFNPINDVALGTIPDVSGSEDYADSVYLLYNAGIVTGSDAVGTFHPDSNIQRSEVAAIATRIVDKTARKQITLEEKVTAPSDENADNTVGSDIPCYPNSNVPDFGALLEIEAYSVDEVEGATRYVYRDFQVLQSKHAEDFVIAYGAELEKNGYAYVTSVERDSGDVVLAFGDGTTGVLITTTTLEDGAEYLLIVFGAHEVIFAV